MRMNGVGIHSLLSVFDDVSTLTFRKGTFLIRPDEPPGGLYLLISGYVKVYSITPDGDEKLQILFQPNEFFPLLWILLDIHRPLYYEAMQRVVLKKISKQYFQEWMRQHPQMWVDVSKYILTLTDMYIDRIDTLEIGHAYSRIISCLLFFAQRFGAPHGESMIIPVPLTHSDIASALAMSRETVSREMEILKHKGLIDYTKQVITIGDIDLLKREFTHSYEHVVL